MSDIVLTQIAPPWFLIDGSAEPLLIAKAREWATEGFTVRDLRGEKMRTVQATFDEMAASLQFPDYFGHNWPALDECLADLEWLPPGRGYALVITNAADVLSHEPDHRLDVLVKIFRNAAMEWNQAVSLGEWWDRPAVPFHVVLHAAADQASTVRQRWSDAGADLEPI